MKVIIENATGEIVEKKSRFIANIFYVANIEDANEKLNQIKKNYYDAKHNCYAYVIGINGDTVKSSDDGEPQGTAGHPMLDILKGNELTNCIAIVTRYFGGILLGTGGLVRAYSDSLKSAISNAKFSELFNAYEVSFSINYDDYGKIENVVQSINQLNVNRQNIYSTDKVFEDKVKLKYLVNTDAFDKLSKELTNITKGEVILDKNNQKNYYLVGKEIKYL